MCKSKSLRLNSLCGNKKIFVGRGFRGCGKTPKLSFRGRGLPEESAFFLVLVKKQIPRCARDDKIADFFRSLLAPFRLLIPSSDEQHMPTKSRDWQKAQKPVADLPTSWELTSSGG